MSLPHSAGNKVCPLEIYAPGVPMGRMGSMSGYIRAAVRHGSRFALAGAAIIGIPALLIGEKPPGQFAAEWGLPGWSSHWLYALHRTAIAGAAGFVVGFLDWLVAAWWYRSPARPD